MRSIRAISRETLGRCALLLALAVFIVRSAWVADDAYITFRTLDNWALGYGPVWNIAERVQAYTHPLWMLLLACVHRATGELYYTSLMLSLMASLGAGALLLWRAGADRLLLIGLLLCSCKAFIDFSTSGLEDPLSHLLIVMAGLSLLHPAPSVQTLRKSALWVALAGTCRLDLLLLLGPALFFQWRSLRGQTGRWQALFLGFLPLLIWEVSATLYYGSPVPNSVQAKLGARPVSELVPQGLLYLWNSLRWDPVLLLTCALGIGPSLVVLRRDWRPSGGLALGGLLYVIYVVLVGGDFMSGRFLTEPFVVALILLVHAESLPRQPARLLAAAALCQGLVHPYSPWRSGSDFTHDQWDDAAIADERGYYYNDTGLLHLWRHGRDPVKPGRSTPTEERRVVVMETVGIDGYTEGPMVHIVDKLALGDPLLSRLPCTDDMARVGHWKRDLPVGYAASLREGQNLISDPETAELFADVQILTRGEILAPERLGLIWKRLF